ncbi:MAG: ABC transporter permease [Terracidiphilus sp.]
MNSPEIGNTEQGTDRSPGTPAGIKPVAALRAGLRGVTRFAKEIRELFLQDMEVLTRELRHLASEGWVPQVPILGTGNSEDSTSPTQQPPFGRGIFFKSFLGLFLRDLRVLTREFVPFLLRVGMQPLLFLFVFTFILPRMATGNPMAVGGGGSSGAAVDFGTILLPGLMAVAIMFSGIAAVALPLSSEFGITREIDDRVMCPLPLWAVALEKVCFSAMQSIIAALMVIPMAYYIPAKPVVAHVASWFLFALVLLLASLLAGSLGLVIGSTVNPKQIGLVFSIIVVPITFLGCVYYPWMGLFKNIRWLSMAVLFNPIVYMSEGLRAAVTPSIGHMPWWAILVALVFFTAALGRWGLKGFLGRVLS